MNTEEYENEQNPEKEHILRQQIEHIERAQRILASRSRNGGTESIPFPDPPTGQSSIITHLQSLQDPDMAHNLFYDMQHIIIRAIPDKDVRKPILDLKTLYLNRGKIGGADSRQAYTSDIGEILNTLNTWIASGANPVDLYFTLVSLNEDAGYTIPEEMLLK